MTFEAGPVRGDRHSENYLSGMGRRAYETLSLKTVFDKVFSFFALVLLAPVMAVIVLVLRLSEPGPVLYAHTRIGRNGRPFKCYKFRTMRENGAARLAWLLEIDPISREDWDTDQKLGADPRVHSVGRFLRKTSLDELPQFWNVLVGDMSLVGPRPIVADEAKKYGKHFADYCSVRPGITGAWQVSGRNSVCYQERVRLDVDYVRNATMLGDFLIVLRTFNVVLMQKGAS